MSKRLVMVPQEQIRGLDGWFLCRIMTHGCSDAKATEAVLERLVVEDFESYLLHTCISDFLDALVFEATTVGMGARHALAQA